MEALRRLSLRREARVITIRSIEFAGRLRERSSEFVSDPWQPFEALGDELATLATAVGASERERRALVQGLEAGLKRVGLSDTAQVHVLAHLAPRIMSGLSATRHLDPVHRLAV